MAEPKPLIAAALFCEKLLVETDSVISAIRIVDELTVDVPGDLPAGATPAVKIRALLAFKSGDARGKHVVKVVERRPSGKTVVAQPDCEIDLRGGDHGMNLLVDLTLAVVEEGTYWFDVLVDGELATSMPLRLRLQASQSRNS